jgi:bifunctional non-homologous end joining protein LigD
MSVRFKRRCLVVDVAFVEWTRHGMLRHPTFVGIRNDKPAREVGRER